MYELSSDVWQICPKRSGLNNKHWLFSQFLWVKNLEAAWLGGSGSGPAMRFQSNCWPRMRSSEGVSGAGGVAVGRRPQLLTPWTSPWSCLHIFTTWLLAFTRMSHPRERARRRSQHLLSPDLRSRTLSLLHLPLLFVRSKSLSAAYTQSVARWTLSLKRSRIAGESY